MSVEGSMFSQLETSQPQPYMNKTVWIRVLVMVICSLSIFGAALIIISYACFKELRSRGRQILAHISIMDLGAALCNLVGSAVYFDQYYSYQPMTNCTLQPLPIYPPSPVHPVFPPDQLVWCPRSLAIKDLCILQASFASFFTLGSIFWSSCLSVYLYFRIVYTTSSLAKHAFRFSCVVCYVAPLFLTVWLLLTGRLGYSPFESAGWCSIILYDPSSNRRDIFASIFGYNLWILLTFILVPLLSLAVHVHVKKLKSTAIYRSSDRMMLDLRNIDYKFLLVPVVFIALRFWSFLGDVLHVYIGLRHISTWIAIILIVLQGIGDSGQGFTNAVIFVFLTRKVREAFCRPWSPCRQWKQNVNIQKDSEQSSLLDNSYAEEQTVHPLYPGDDHTPQCSLTNN